MQPRAKLAVILHADVVGSTLLVQQDERIAHERMQAVFQRLAHIINQYDGIVHELRGDALVAEFERASDSVSAGLAFQAENQADQASTQDSIQPRLRIGIALGEVVIADGTITGAGVVLAQRLEQIAETGGLCISAAIREALPARLPFEYGALGEQSVKGFDEPVRVFIVALGDADSVPEPEPHAASPKASANKRWGMLAIPLLLLVAAGLLLWLKPGIFDTSPTTISDISERPSVVVLPLRNLSGDASQDSLAQAISEGITSELSRFEDLFVISADSANHYRNLDSTPQQIGQELGVRYVLIGSMQRSGDRLRVSTQLIDVVTNAQAWTGKYDRTVADIFVVQDEIVQASVTALGETIWRSAAKKLAAKPLENFEAYDYMLRAKEVFHKLNQQANEEARSLWLKSSELDPDLGFPFLGLAWTYYLEYRSQWQKTGPEALDKADEYLNKAALVMGDHYEIHRLKAKISQARGEFDKALTHNERALSLNPNDGDLLVAQGQMLTFAGRSDEARGWVEEAMRRNPHYPGWYASALALIQYLQRDFEGTIETLTRVGNPAIWDHRYLAAAYGQLGREAEATKQRVIALEANPEFSIGEFEATLKFRNKQDKDLFLEGLLKAGFPP